MTSRWLLHDFTWNKKETCTLACPIPVFGAVPRAQAVGKQTWRHLCSSSTTVAATLLVEICAASEDVDTYGDWDKPWFEPLEKSQAPLSHLINRTFQNVSVGLIQWRFQTLSNDFQGHLTVPKQQDDLRAVSGGLEALREQVTCLLRNRMSHLISLLYNILPISLQDFLNEINRRIVQK